jgi:hypothetical protein
MTMGRKRNNIKMSRIIYEKISNEYLKYSYYIERTELKDIATSTYKLLLELIDVKTENKTDDEFNNLFYRYINNITLTKSYYTRLFNPNRECYFNSFASPNNFIEILFSNINDIDFYRELNIILNEFIKKRNDINKDVKKIKKVKEIKQKKKTITATMKRLVWNMNIGEEIGKAKCLCCKSTDITQLSFNCGHIIAEANGGETVVSNMRPICQNCNSSMATRNMDEFMESLK